MEIWLAELEKALCKLTEQFGDLCQYVASIQGCYHGIIFCMTSGEIWKYNCDNDTVIKMEGDWR